MTELARRSEAQVIFAGTDISGDVRPYLEDLTYTDNEEDETDDLQITLSDGNGVWVEHWLYTGGDSTAGGGSGDGDDYIVTAKTGAQFRSGAGADAAKIGTIAYGTHVTMLDNDGSWAHVQYGNRTGYVHMDCLRRASSSSSDWKVGDDVTVTGAPQYTSYGEGRPGTPVTNYKGKITYLNMKADVPYPIHVGYLGWFAEGQVQKSGAANTAAASSFSAGGHYAGGASFLGGVTKGLIISAAIRSWNGVLSCGQFELDSVQGSGPPDKVTIKGTALPYASSIRQTDKSQAWENYDLKGIAEEIAGRNGMACLFYGNSNPSYDRVEQYKQSDLLFLKKLCNDAGCSLKVSNNILIVFEQAEFERRPPIFTIDRHGSAYTKYSLKTGKDDTYSSCEVKWTTPDGECIVGTAQSDDSGKEGQCLRITQKVNSVAEAETLAAQQLRLHNKMELTATFTVPGNPGLLAGCPVRLTSWGDWSGKYIIKKAKHSLNSKGYTTQIELRKV